MSFVLKRSPCATLVCSPLRRTWLRVLFLFLLEMSQSLYWAFPSSVAFSVSSHLKLHVPLPDLESFYLSAYSLEQKQSIPPSRGFSVILSVTSWEGISFKLRNKTGAVHCIDSSLVFLYSEGTCPNYILHFFPYVGSLNLPLRHLLECTRCSSLYIISVLKDLQTSQEMQLKTLTLSEVLQYRWPHDMD